jgi:hypothetical protein
MKSQKAALKNRTTLWHAVSVWGFLALAVMSGFISLQAYIGNSKESKKRYDTLLAVDAAGGDVEKALLNLRTYIYQHMNTTIGSPTGVRPPIQLSGTYNRLLTAEQARVKTANDDVYAKAQKECERLVPDGLSGRGRIPCITEYVTKNPVKEQPIPEGLYQYDFVAPKWSPDTAGIGFIVTFTLLGVFVYRLVSYSKIIRHLYHTS